jgi:hypothetical protein
MVSKNNINLNTNRFKTPKGYFEDITIDNIKKIERKGFKVPQNYFETINIDLINNTNYLSKIINFKYREFALSGIAAALVIGLFINGFFSDSNSFKDAEILDYMNYELVGYSSYDYIELFDVNEFEINFNQLNDNDFEYYLETSFSDDQNLNNE